MTNNQIGMLIVLSMVTVVSIITLTGWAIHKEMTIDHSISVGGKWGFGTFKDFIREYHKLTWTSDVHFPKSQFSYKTDSEYSGYIHASIICFGNNGMVLYPWSWVRFLVWSRQQNAGRRLYKEGLWKC